MLALLGLASVVARTSEGGAGTITGVIASGIVIDRGAGILAVSADPIVDHPPPDEGAGLAQPIPPGVESGGGGGGAEPTVDQPLDGGGGAAGGLVHPEPPEVVPIAAEVGGGREGLPTLMPLALAILRSSFSSRFRSFSFRASNSS